ncbi:MAG TPA: EAL domain-containing protein, partial [Gammaproteobacteria bacterium]|nr:EAL domain-containing protein [Gammaproteobacteria bacterium]
LSLDSVAEGIESEQQLAFLTRHGCEFGQGHYFSRPVAASEIAKILADRGVRSSTRHHAKRERVAAAAR